MNIKGKTDKQLRRMCVNHWKRMLTLSIEDIRSLKEAPSVGNCAFCNRYVEVGCKDCPVCKKTKMWLCKGTPYLTAYSYYVRISKDESKALVRFRNAVQKEIDFLESLEC